MTEFEQILAEYSSDVKINNQHLENLMEEIDFNNLPVDGRKSREVSDNLPYKQIKQALTKLVAAEEVNNLTDSFRSQKTEKVESRTEGSLKETLARYHRQASIIQNHS